MKNRPWFLSYSSLTSFTKSHRLLFSFLAAACVLSLGSFTLAAVISGTSTTSISDHITLTRLSISKPTTSVGDVMVASIAVNGGSTVNVTAPTGWTQITRADNDINVALISYWKVATASEPSSLHG